MQSNTTINLLEEKKKFYEEYNKDDASLSSSEREAVELAEKVNIGNKILQARDFFKSFESSKKLAQEQEELDKEQSEKITKEIERVAEKHIANNSLCVDIYTEQLDYIKKEVDSMLSKDDEWTSIMLVGKESVMPILKIQIAKKVNKSKRKELITIDVPFNFKATDKYLSEDEIKMSDKEFIQEKFLYELNQVLSEIKNDFKK